VLQRKNNRVVWGWNEAVPFLRIIMMARKNSFRTGGSKIGSSKIGGSKAGSSKTNGSSADTHRVPMREFSRSLPMSLLRAREAVMRQFRPSLRNHGLTEQQWRILRALAAVDSIEVTELARVAFLLGPSLSRILRDLEARHLIERKVAKSDLRRADVSISTKGLKLIEAVAPTSEAIYAAITRRYGARKLAELQDMLGVLEGSLAGMGQDNAGEDE
jgi:homoprotocatechuate degradation regulator HpaR